ncbi:MAG: isochorismatase family protein [Planctomycetota bacterium]|nr:MAG: isochorismatase family protein [Planctomycetota bacterium]
MRASIIFLLLLRLLTKSVGADEPQPRTYQNQLRRIENAKPLLADYPEYFEPIQEEAHFEAAAIVNDEGADLHVRAWRFSYNARGIIEMPNHLRAAETAVIMVHPWAIDDEWGWRSPQPNGVADFCTPTKNAVAATHTKEVVDPFLKRLRGKAACVMYSLPGPADPVRTKIYRSFSRVPTAVEREAGEKELRQVLADFDYTGEPLPETLTLGNETPVIDYFKQFPGLDSGARFNHEGFWNLPIPVCTSVSVDPQDVVIYDAEGYAPLREFLKKNGVRHVLLTGYATDMCYCRTTAGYENLSKDFNVFLVADASLATFPSNTSPRFAVNAAISFAALNQLITQVSWVTLEPEQK